jgi:predicted transcriptional regulator
MAEPESIFDDIDEAAEARAIAETDVAAGRVVPHEKVREWLKSWGTADERPAPLPKKP